MEYPHNATERSSSQNSYGPKSNEARLCAGDEVSFIELAKVLYRRRLAFFVAVFAVFSIAVIFVVLRGDNNLYMSEYRLSSDSAGKKAILSGDQVSSLVDGLFIPALKRDLAIQALPQVDTLVLDGSVILKLKTVYPESRAAELTEIHKALLDKLLQYESKLYSTRKDEIIFNLTRVKTNFESAQRTYEQAGEGAISPDLLEGYRKEISDWEEKLYKLQPPEIIAVAEHSGIYRNIGNGFILAVGAVVSVVFSLLFVFFAEFIYRVKISLKEDGLIE